MLPARPDWATQSLRSVQLIWPKNSAPSPPPPPPPKKKERKKKKKWTTTQPRYHYCYYYLWLLVINTPQPTYGHFSTIRQRLAVSVQSLKKILSPLYSCRRSPSFLSTASASSSCPSCRSACRDSCTGRWDWGGGTAGEGGGVQMTAEGFGRWRGDLCPFRHCLSMAPWLLGKGVKSRLACLVTAEVQINKFGYSWGTD